MTTRSRSALRIIPALAGNTATHNDNAQTSEDHPRSRGEYAPCRGCCPAVWGSSPLSRGIQGSMVRITGGARIIPALAGNTYGCYLVPGLGRDHPRSRGEYWKRNLPPVESLGSSPLSRGIRLSNSAPANNEGIIPALAGNTDAGRGNDGPHKDHPRSRGEYSSAMFRKAQWRGSSPLSRGIPFHDWTPVSSRRIIPALAGNTPVIITEL